MRKNILILFFISQTYSQTPNINWSKCYGGNNGDFFRSVVSTLDGGFFMGGWSNSGISGNKTENIIGFNPDYWVIKTNSLGDIEWQKTIGGGRFWAFGEENGDILNVVKQSNDGGFFLGGQSDSPIIGLKTQPNYGLDDFWVVKLDPMGNIIWQTSIGGSNNDRLNSLEITSDGGCIVGGLSASNISGNKTENSRGSWDYWVVKLDINGQIEWQKTIGGSDYDELTSILVLDDNEYLLCGYSNSNLSGDKTDNSKGYSDYWIVKINNLGNIIWQKTIGGTGGDLLYRSIKTDDGFIFGGASTSNISFDKTENSRGLLDFWIVKTSFNGSIIWDKTYGGNDDDYLLDLKTYTNGDLILAGVSYSPISGEKSDQNYGLYDSWFMRINPNGNLIWEKTIGGDDGDGFNQVVVNQDNSVLLGGISDSNTIQNLNILNNGNYDYWLVKLEPETLQNDDFNDIIYSLSPNPTLDNVNIQFKERQNKIKIIVCNSLSQKIAEFNYTNTSAITIPINETKGIYFLKVILDDNETNALKVIKK